MSLRIVQSRRPGPVFVCRKCLKRSNDPKAIKTAIKRAVKSGRGRSSGEKPARVVLTSCFGLCPKRAVVITGGTRGEYLLVSATEDVPGALALLREDQNTSSRSSSSSSRAKQATVRSAMLRINPI
ncbi:hypothetical protein [Bradyrhizobium sp. HKCCYLS20291]|uniref:hypothetical protein n=1 Tax=Bradyrhizobium sp. HKCCYLS20291 TaxID=3420766 RepID=UPI003EC0B91A